MDVAATINACLEAKNAMEAKGKKVDEWKLADNIDRKKEDMKKVVTSTQKSKSSWIWMACWMSLLRRRRRGSAVRKSSIQTK